MLDEHHEILHSRIQKTEKQSPEVFYKKTVLKSFSTFTGKHHHYQKETPTQVFSCEYCEIFRNTYFEEYLRTAAFENSCPNFYSEKM